MANVSRIASGCPMSPAIAPPLDTLVQVLPSGDVATTTVVFGGVIADQFTTVEPHTREEERERTGEIRVPELLNEPSTRATKLWSCGAQLAAAVESVTLSWKEIPDKDCPGVKFGITPPFVTVCHVLPPLIVDSTKILVL